MVVTCSTTRRLRGAADTPWIKGERLQGWKAKAVGLSLPTLRIDCMRNYTCNLGSGWFHNPFALSLATRKAGASEDPIYSGLFLERKEILLPPPGIELRVDVELVRVVLHRT
jgi:hypothetical protein